MRISTLIVAVLAANLVSAQDQGFTSELHSKNLGRIVWAKERILKDSQDRVPLATAFQYGEPIYGRVYFAKSIVDLGRQKNCQNDRAQFRIKAIVDGADKGWIHRHYLESPSWTTVQVVLSLAPGDEKDRMNLGLPEKWSEIAGGLSSGSHQVKIEWFGQEGDNTCGVKLAEGEFTLVKSDKPVQPAAKGQKLPPALMKNASLEASMVQAVRSRGWKNEEPVKVVIIEQDWRMIRDPLGTITHREINTHVALRKLADGTYRGTDISFRQEARRGGQWGPTEVYGIGMKNYPVDPAEVK